MKNRERRIGEQAIRVISAPFRALCRARNKYVSSMNSLADHLPYGAGCEAMSYPRISFDEGRSFSGAQTSSGEDDFRELVRVSSQSSVTAAGEAVRRSRSVAVGRIDEDAPCNFTGDVGVGESLIFPRSRTCGAGGKKVAFGHM